MPWHGFCLQQTLQAKLLRIYHFFLERCFGCPWFMFNPYQPLPPRGSLPSPPFWLNVQLYHCHHTASGAYQVHTVQEHPPSPPNTHFQREPCFWPHSPIKLYLVISTCAHGSIWRMSPHWDSWYLYIHATKIPFTGSTWPWWWYIFNLRSHYYSISKELTTLSMCHEDMSRPPLPIP